MKGRRRARELALQALYELDQSSHALDDVLATRVEGYYQSIADSAASGDLRSTMLYLLAERDFRRESPSPWAVLATDKDLAAALSLAPELLAEGLTLFQRHGALVEYGVAVVRGVLGGLVAIDKIIRAIAPEWPVAQMAPVDRNLLRIALWEIGSQAVPVRVAINEAVELARRYSGESARRMVNGALGSFAKHPDTLKLEPYRSIPALEEDDLPANDHEPDDHRRETV